MTETLFTKQETSEEKAERIRRNNDRLFFINNMRQRRRLPRVFTIEEAESWYSSIQGAKQ